MFGSEGQVGTARAAAVAFARRHGYPAEEIERIGGEPVLGPVDFERDGATVTAYRWIGAGRGSSYIQVEIGAGTPIVVRGARGDAGLDAWVYEPERGH